MAMLSLINPKNRLWILNVSRWAIILLMLISSKVFSMNYKYCFDQIKQNRIQYDRIELLLTPPSDLGASVIGYLDKNRSIVAIFGDKRQLLTYDHFSFYPISEIKYYVEWKSKEFDGPTYYPSSQVIAEKIDYYVVDDDQVQMLEDGNWVMIDDLEKAESVIALLYYFLNPLRDSLKEVSQ